MLNLFVILCLVLFILVIIYIVFPRFLPSLRSTRKLIIQSEERLSNKKLLLDQIDKNKLFLKKLELIPDRYISEYEYNVAKIYLKEIYPKQLRSFAECSGEVYEKWSDQTIREYVSNTDKHRSELFLSAYISPEDSSEDSLLNLEKDSSEHLHQILRDIKNIHEKLNSNISGSFYKNSLNLESMYIKSESNSVKHTILSQLDFILKQLKLEDVSNTSKEERYLINQLNINERYLSKLKDLEVF